MFDGVEKLIQRRVEILVVTTYRLNIRKDTATLERILAAID